MVTAELGAPTVLVNNAGITRDNLLFKMTEDDWDAVMDVHLQGRSSWPRAAEAHDRSEVGPHREPVQRLGAGQPRPGQLLHRQGRLQGFTKTLAVELGKFGVTANASRPGSSQPT